MTLSTFFVEFPYTLMCPTIISSRSREITLVTLEKQSSPKKSLLRVIWSLNIMQQGIIRITAQHTDGSPIEPKDVLSKWRNDCGVVAMGK
jgi:ABC-type arginine transport system ATPase subunit